MWTLLKLGALAVIFTLFLIGGHYVFAEIHELTHARICKSFGGVVSDIEVNIFETSSMTCTIHSTQEYILAQANVDAFGYQLLTFMELMIMFVFVVLASWKLLRL